MHDNDEHGALNQNSDYHDSCARGSSFRGRGQIVT